MRHCFRVCAETVERSHIRTSVSNDHQRSSATVAWEGKRRALHGCGMMHGCVNPLSMVKLTRILHGCAYPPSMAELNSFMVWQCNSRFDGRVGQLHGMTIQCPLHGCADSLPMLRWISCTGMAIQHPSHGCDNSPPMLKWSSIGGHESQTS